MTRCLRRGMTTALAVIVMLLADTAMGTEDGASWPQWRGPSRDARLVTTGWPDKLGEDVLQQVWRIELSPSYSGPIAVGSRVFVTETKDARYEVVRAFDRANGQQLWSAEWEGAMSVPFFAKANGDWIRSTPACDGERLYVAGMRDVLVCLDVETGKEVWRVDFVEDYEAPLPQFGFVCSPLVDDDHVYVQAGACFAKLDKRTGKLVWRALQDQGGMMGSAFSSPIMATLGGTRQLVVQTRTTLAGVAADSGQELWSQEIPAFRGMNILTPTVVDDTVFTSSYGGRSFLYRITGNADSFDVAELWTNKVQGYMSSPVVIDGHIYLHLRNQRFTCIDLQTGDNRWTTKPFGKYWSLVSAGDKILALDERGELRLIRANPQEFQLLDERDLSDNSWAHLAVCDDQLFIRELNALQMLRWRVGGDPAPRTAAQR